jgi:PII-like signaling protein
MGIELFGSTYAIYFAAACFLSYLLSGHSGIYLSQRIAVPKGGSTAVIPDTSLRAAREQPPPADVAPSDIGSEDAVPALEHGVNPSEIGQLRIYLSRRDRPGGAGMKRLLGRRPLYRRIIAAAREEGILNAVMHSSHYGYTARGTIVGEGVDPNPNLTIHVELIADRDLLEAFCRKYGDLLAGKVIVYKHMEHWEITPHGVERSESTVDEPLQ